MTTVHTIREFVQRLSGHPLNKDEGVHYGLAERNVNRATVSWMATADALRFAGERGSGLIITHESLFYPIGALIEEGSTKDWQAWRINRQRQALLDQYGMTLFRAHGSLDDICVFDDFAALLELGDPIEAQGLVKVYKIEPCAVAELVARAKRCTGLPAVRVAAPNGLDQQVHRIGLPWGGLGLHENALYLHFLVEKQCDVFIAGEGDNFGARFAAELGIPTIETDHEVSENPGLRHFADMLNDEFPDLDVAFYECARIWQTV